MKCTFICPRCTSEFIYSPKPIEDVDQIAVCTSCGAFTKILNTHRGWKVHLIADGDFAILKFPNTAIGQRSKINALSVLTSNGWIVINEIITPGKFKGEAACFLFMICAPLAFLAGHEDDVITVTLQYHVVPTEPAKADIKKCPFCAELIKREAIKCRFCGEMLPTIQQTQ